MKFKPYPKYKPSGVEWLGNVPEGWSVVKLGAVSVIETGPFGSQLHSDEYVEGGCPVINPAHIQGGEIVPDESVTVDAQTATRLARHVLNAGDIVFGRRGEMGRCALVNEAAAGWLCGTGSLKVALNRQQTCGNFVAAALRTPLVKEWLQLESVGSTMDNLNATILSRVPLVFPGLREQRIIASFLDRETAKIDALIAKQETLIKLLQEKRQAVISHAVTKGLDQNAPMKPSGVEWLGDVPKSWSVKMLKWMATLHRGYDLTDSERNDGPYPVVTSGGINGMHSDYMAIGPGVVTGRYGSTGTWHFIESNFWPHNTSLFVSDFHGNDHRFIWYSMQVVDVKTHSVKAAVPGVDRNDLHVTFVVVPPLGDQIAIVEHLEAETKKIDTLIAKAQQAIDLQKEHRTALISAAVTGKIDVRGMVQQEVSEAKAA